LRLNAVSDALGLLRLDSPGKPAYLLPYLIYGKIIYGIARYIKQISNDAPQIEEGSLYPALQRLPIKGWVKAEWGQSENNRRARLYKLTPAGRKRLKQEVADFERVLEAILRVVQPT